MPTRPKSIFDYVNANNITAYWNTRPIEQNYMGEELFNEQQKLGLSMEMIYGAKGLPVVLKPSAYDVAALKRDRIGFNTMRVNMPFFKESMMIDEELRQQLNQVIETGNRAYIDTINRMIFDDEMQLLRGARAQRERMRMMLLTTGSISISANGQNYDYDYGMSEDQKVTVTTSWSDPNADIMGDIYKWIEEATDRYGVAPDRAILNSITLNYMVKNTDIKNAIWGNDSTAAVSKSKIISYVQDETKLSLGVYDARYRDENKQAHKFVPDDTFVLIPPGKLGTGWFGTTPEQSDLMSGSAANVSIIDTGVAVTTSKKIDPVNVDTKVSMIYLPSFEAIEGVVIADVKTD